MNPKTKPLDRTVLLAEDDLLIQKLATAVLARVGYKTLACENGQLCLDVLSQGLKPDLLLLDLHMPVVDGFQVLQQMSKTGAIESFPIMILTASNQQDVVMRALEMGAHDFVVKPFAPMDLAKRITDLVFHVDEPALRTVVANLRMHDPSLFRMHGLKTWARKGFDAYPAAHDGKSICVLIPEGVGPTVLAKAPHGELASKVHVFRKCNYGYRKVWPTYSVLKPLRSAG